jgi:hypothetical protein
MCQRHNFWTRRRARRQQQQCHIAGTDRLVEGRIVRFSRQFENAGLCIRRRRQPDNADATREGHVTRGRLDASLRDQGARPQIGEIFFEQLKLPVVKKTPGGAPSTDEEVLDELAADYPLPAKLLEHRSLSKLKGTYTDNLVAAINLAAGAGTLYGSLTVVNPSATAVKGSASTLVA